MLGQRGADLCSFMFPMPAAGLGGSGGAGRGGVPPLTQRLWADCGLTALTFQPFRLRQAVRGAA